MFRRDRLVNLAKSELAWWNGRKETDPAVAKRLVKMWQQGAGWGWVTMANIHQVDNEYPWSSAGLSYLVRKVYTMWPKAASHSEYTIWARERRKAGEQSMIALNPDEYRPVPGDIIVKHRGSFNGTLDQLYNGATSHGDIVISNSGGQVKAIGFNLGDTVKEVSYSAPNGYLTNGQHFAVIKMGSI